MGTEYWSNKINYKDAKHSIIDTAKFLYEAKQSFIEPDLHGNIFTHTHTDALQKISARYTKEAFKKLVLIHSGFASAGENPDVVIEDAKLLKELSKKSKRPLYSSVKRTYQAYLSKMLHSNAGETEYDSTDHKLESCLKIIDNWSKLGLEKARLKSDLDKIMKITDVHFEPYFLADLMNLYNRAGFNGRELPQEMRKNITNDAMSEIYHRFDLGVRNLLKVTDFLGDDFVEMNKVNQRQLLKRANFYLTKKGWEPETAIKILELVEKKGSDVNPKWMAVKNNLHSYFKDFKMVSKRRQKDKKRKIINTVKELGYSY